ncbi:uncharacterized protein isoform X2 [Leptinotarsa decemlineata]|uniref:uncharacterized protein isoform X2 n=1 Tax=Leptinotarsa decemlineata TaxID=7539 RepID=UPI003D309EBB
MAMILLFLFQSVITEMYSKRTDRIMSLVPTQVQHQNIFINKMCNVALTPVKKINIISDVIISSAKYDEEKIPSPSYYPIRGNFQVQSNINENEEYQSKSDTSSPPPNLEFSDFEVDSPASITYKKDTEIVELMHECDMIPEPGLSKYCEALLNEKEVISLLRVDEQKIFFFQNYSPFDDSDADPTYSPSVFIKTHTDFQMMFIKVQKFLSSFCCSKMEI